MSAEADGVSEKKPVDAKKLKMKKYGATKMFDDEETITEKPKEKSAEPEEKPKAEKIGAKKLADQEEKTNEKPKNEKSAGPDENKSGETEDKPKAKKISEVKRKSMGEKKLKKAEEQPTVESIDEPDHLKVDNVNEDDVKPSSKPSSRRGSKKEKSPEKITLSIEVYFHITKWSYSSLDLSPIIHSKFTHNLNLNAK